MNNLEIELTDTISEILFEPKLQKKETKHRGGRPEMFCKAEILKNFVRFTGSCWSLLLNKVAG